MFAEQAKSAQDYWAEAYFASRQEERAIAAISTGGDANVGIGEANVRLPKSDDWKLGWYFPTFIIGRLMFFVLGDIENSAAIRRQMCQTVVGPFARSPGADRDVVYRRPGKFSRR